MTDTCSLPAITRLYQACEPLESLHPVDPRWVDFDEVRGDENVVQIYARSLRRAPPDRPDFKLFTGHRGVGKTSELFRLKDLLEQPQGSDKGFLVVLCDVSDRLDVNDLDWPDLLVFVAAQLQRQLADKELPGFTPVTTYLKRVWDDIRGILGSEVELTGVEVETGFGKLTTELRNRPNSRSLLRDAVEKHSTSLLVAVNDLLISARVAAVTAGTPGSCSSSTGSTSWCGGDWTMAAPIPTTGCSSTAASSLPRLRCTRSTRCPSRSSTRRVSASSSRRSASTTRPSP